MGIYSDGRVYGIRLTLAENILFEETWSETIDLGLLAKGKQICMRLTDTQKSAMDVRFYMASSSTYDVNSSGTCMAWWPVGYSSLEQLFQTLIAN
jgi:hypothetical protein